MRLKVGESAILLDLALLVLTLGGFTYGQSQVSLQAFERFESLIPV